MSEPAHGDYDPHKGWYSANHRGWLTDPSKIGRLPKPVTVHDGHRADWERQQRKQSGKDFRVNSQLEQLIKLRESDKPEDRSNFEQIAKGANRITLHDYEAKRQGHLDSGGEID
jgi:hypothetical protein